MSRTISAAELARHGAPEDLWVAVDGDVYDLSAFAEMHPGGARLLEQVAGNDVTTEFFELHRSDVLRKYGRLIVGRLEASGAKLDTDGEISEVPFAEIPAFQWQHSPYFKESHRSFLKAVRRFVQTELVPIAAMHDVSGEYPDKELRGKIGMAGLFVTRIGPGPWMPYLKGTGIELPGGVSVEEFDYFHEMVAHQEISRIGLPGFIDSLGTGWLISAPAIFNFGTEAMKSTVGVQLLKGEKDSVLAISEPFAGSDVAALRTTAVKSACGKFYIVNGIKKWITEGMYADYFVTAVRTGGKGSRGISVLLIERSEGVETTQIKTTYSVCAGTSLVVFRDVKVPVENLLGVENDGFKLIMYNFNHERWMIVNSLIGQARAAIADTFMWANQRKIFGKRLIDQPVIRNKLAQSVAELESVQCFNEALTYDMCMAKDGPLGTRLAGPIAMLKYQSTRMAWKVADDCVQIMGGRGITRTGMGAKVEGFKNFAKYAAVYGGSEEIMADLAVKQAMKRMPATARM